MRGATRRRVLLAGAAGVVLGAREVRAAQFISVLTGGTGGVYYPLGVALAQIFNNDIAGAKATAQVTKGVGREPDAPAAGQGRARLLARGLAAARLQG